MPETLFYYQFSVWVKTMVKDLPPSKSYLHTCVRFGFSYFTVFAFSKLYCIYHWFCPTERCFCLELSSCLANQTVKPEADTEVLRFRESWKQKGCYLLWKSIFLLRFKSEHNFISDIHFPSPIVQPSKTEETAGLLLWALAQWHHLGKPSWEKNNHLWNWESGMFQVPLIHTHVPQLLCWLKGAHLLHRDCLSTNLGSWKRMSRCVSQSWHQIKKQIRTRGFLWLIWLQVQAYRKHWLYAAMSILSDTIWLTQKFC